MTFKHLILLFSKMFLFLPQIILPWCTVKISSQQVGEKKRQFFLKNEEKLLTWLLEVCCIQLLLCSHFVTSCLPQFYISFV